MCEQVALEGLRDGGLEFLRALVGARGAAAVGLGEGGDVDFCFDRGVVVVSLASSVEVMASCQLLESWQRGGR